MKKPNCAATLAATAAALALLLSACSGGSNDDAAAPPTPARSLGLMQLTVNGIGSSAMSSHAVLLHPGQRANVAGLSADEPNGLDVEQVSASTVDVGTRGIDGTRYISVVYKVRNAQNCATPGTCTAYTSASKNLSFVGANAAGNLNNTAVTAIYLENGSTSSAVQALATQMLPTDGMAPSNPAGGVLLASGQESLQVFNESEIVGSFVDPGATYLFPYGYVVENVNTPSSRSLPANPANNQWDGQLTFAFKVPLQASVADDPFSISFVFDVLDDSNTRVSESAEAQNADGDTSFNQLATALGSTDLAVLGGHIAATNIGDPICTVRIAGPASAPTAYLVNNSGGPTPASAPSNLMLAPAATVNFGFCTPMDTTTASATTVVLNGSESGPHAGNFTDNGNVLSFVPTKAFTPGETVSYTLTTGLRSGGGTALAQALVGGFNIGGLTPSSGAFAADSSPMTPPSRFSEPYAAAVGDFNGDGKLDFVVTDYSNFDTPTVAVYLGNGDGTFTFSARYRIAFNGYFPIVGDFNGDGKLDIIASSSFLPGNGDGTFGTAVAINTNSGSDSSSVAGDFNGDGILDLASGFGSDVIVSLGNGDGTFGPPISTPSPTGNANNVAIGDFNGDGKLDIAAGDEGDNLVVIFLGNGDGTFTASPVTYPVGQDPYAIVTGDFNGDGKLDIATANVDGQTTSVLPGKGDGTFGAAATYALGLYPYNLAAADVNGDGLQDLVFPDPVSGRVAVLLGRKDGTFSGPSIYATGGSQAYNLATGDFNNDGKIDLLFPDDSDIAIVLGQ